MGKQSHISIRGGGQSHLIKRNGRAISVNQERGGGQSQLIKREEGQFHFKKKWGGSSHLIKRGRWQSDMTRRERGKAISPGEETGTK